MKVSIVCQLNHTSPTHLTVTATGRVFGLPGVCPHIKAKALWNGILTLKLYVVSLERSAMTVFFMLPLTFKEVFRIELLNYSSNMKIKHALNHLIGFWFVIMYIYNIYTIEVGLLLKFAALPFLLKLMMLLLQQWQQCRKL